ncbi:MAG: hypothetical protein ACLTD8_11415 [Acutalibacteraceae bacterium]
MPNKLNESMISSFKNPFDDYNANVLDPELIMQYWFTPFSTGALKDFDEKRFFYSKNAYYSARISWFRKDHNLKIFFIPCTM